MQQHLLPNACYSVHTLKRRNRLSSPTMLPLLATLALSLTLSCAKLGEMDWNAMLPAGMPLTESEVGSGLRDALRVGTERAATSLSNPGGFSDNPLLRLALPDQLDTLAKGLRKIGMGGEVDRLENAMNLAAEKAAGEAVPVFANVIGSMSISDAFQILKGPDNAATEYFRQKTSTQLRSRFEPVVASAMQQVGVYDLYRGVVTKYDAIPFTKKPQLPSLEGYVVDKTLAGLFGTLAEEEAAIRNNPAARSTALLKRVFAEPKK
jgi:hypothetical protein